VSTLRLHHVGQLVADIDTARTELCGRFGYRTESAVIVDPVQTARVQFLRLPGGANWLELVSPAGEDSKLSRALKKGVRLHHLCYETPDLPATLASLREKGYFIVCEPVAAAAFPGRRIAWAMDAARDLVEFVEAGPGPLSLSEITA
jgi:methylmalonyl-CoA/ethylmalonyl-CoA epimerase